MSDQEQVASEPVPRPRRRTEAEITEALRAKLHERETRLAERDAAAANKDVKRAMQVRRWLQSKNLNNAARQVNAYCRALMKEHNLKAPPEDDPNQTELDDFLEQETSSERGAETEAPAGTPANGS